MFSRFEELPSSEAVFAHEAWIERSIGRLKKAMELGHSTGVSTVDSTALTAAVLAASQTSSIVRVLDVGGNLGQLGLVLRSRFPRLDLNWHVEEKAVFLDACALRTTMPAEITFHRSGSPSIAASVDPTVVHFGSSLQYISDWRTALEGSTTDSCEWLVLSDLPASEEISTFASAQRYYDGVLPCWFFDRRDVDGFVAALGFELVYLAPFLDERNCNYYPETSLPGEYQIRYPVDVVYRRRHTR